MSYRVRLPDALVAGALGVVVLVALAAGADAHAIVQETVPAIDSTVATSPPRVTMRFNEQVELAFGAIRVYDSNGKRVDEGEARHRGGADTVVVDLDRDLPDGTYTVTWRVVSADGHPIHEAFVFHVGAPGPRPEGIAAELLGGESGAGSSEGALAGAFRWLTFASLLVLVGTIGFAMLVCPGRAVEGDSGARFRRWWWRLLAGSLVGAQFGTVGAYLLQGAVAGDMSLREAATLDVLGEVAKTRFGRVAFARLAVLAALAAVVWAQRDRLPFRAWVGVDAGARKGSRSVVVAGVLAALTVGAAATPGLSGHAGATSPVVVNVLADTVHVISASLWLGGLVLLLAAVLPAARGDAAEVTSARVLVARFSDVAQVAIAAVVASGLVRSWVEVRELRALSEPYGLVLLAKAAVFVPILAAGFVNSRVLKPRLTAEDGSRTAWTTLRRIVAAEVALAAAVLGLTAVLVNVAPARVTAGADGPFVTDVHLGVYHLNVVVDPNEVGENQVHLTATTATGAPAPVEAMSVLFRMPEQDIGPIPAEGVQLAPGHFVVQGRHLSVSGRWSMEVVARTGRFDEERAATSFRVNK